MKSLVAGGWMQRIAAALLIALSVTAAGAEDAYPAKPIRVIVPYPAGGVLDTFARVLTQAIARNWPQPLIVEPRPGASASLGTQLALQAKPDGYTWLIGGSSLVANPLLFRSSAWNPPKDFAGVGGSSPMRRWCSWSPTPCRRRRCANWSISPGPSPAR